MQISKELYVLKVIMEGREKRGILVLLIANIYSQRPNTDDFYKTIDALVLILKVAKE